MPNSEILHRFNENRDRFKPYGLTFEVWVPDVMRKPDRHNEIEINFFPEGNITYLFQGARVTIPPKSFALFWGLVPHQIVDFSESAPYFVGTIPLSRFLEWRFPAAFVDRVLKGEVLIDESGKYFHYDKFIFQQWIDDYAENRGVDASLLEVRARLLRMADRVSNTKASGTIKISDGEISQIERIALFIARKFNHPIKMADIGQEAGLHPDYANSVFKKTFGLTLTEYVTQERVSQAQRKLISTDLSISDICFECGFNSINRFNAAFKRINNCTPSEYRKSFSGFI